MKKAPPSRRTKAPASVVPPNLLLFALTPRPRPEVTRTPPPGDSEATSLPSCRGLAPTALSLLTSGSYSSSSSSFHDMSYYVSYLSTRARKMQPPSSLKEPLIHSALRLHASALSSRPRQSSAQNAMERFAAASPVCLRRVQRIRANPGHFISSVLPSSIIIL